MNTAYDEWQQWEKTLPTTTMDAPSADGVQRLAVPTHPDPHEENGLPPGWRIWSRYANFNAHTDLLLVQRPNLEWVTVYAQRDPSASFMYGTFESLAQMYAQFLADPEPVARTGRDAQWLRRVLVRLFDVHDPFESTERFLVSLGGHPSVDPQVTRMVVRDSQMTHVAGHDVAGHDVAEVA